MLEQAVWDALKPRSCDTHSTSYSATRETFLKLLRPGVDYREAFHKVIRRGTDAARGLGVARAGMLSGSGVTHSAGRNIMDVFAIAARGEGMDIC